MTIPGTVRFFYQGNARHCVGFLWYTPKKLIDVREEKTRMKVDPSSYFSMPLIMGPIRDGTQLKVNYPQVEALVFQYLTDPEALAELLPDCYHPTHEPLVSVIFSENNGLDFMAGGGYRLATV